MNKIPSHLAPYIMKETDPACVAYYRLNVAELHKIILVIDDDEHITGVLTPTDLSKLNQSGLDPECMCAGQISNKNFRFLRDCDDKYLYGRSIFAELPVNDLPILNSEHIPVDLFSRWQAFFRDFNNDRKLQYPYYAVNMMAAATSAAEKGYSKISVIEFGVAGGRGLRHCELFSKEIEKLTGITIEVYGFDSGEGLYAPKDYRDMPHYWVEGEYKMDVAKLQSSLQYAHLVMGDISKTIKTFITEYNPAPIGVMLVDVDQYTPTVAILDLLLEKDEYFLPSVFMYFDDIGPYDAFQGETLAIKEFNNKCANAKISPESLSYNPYFPADTTVVWWSAKIKVCHRFTHENFAKTSSTVRKQMPIHL